MKSSSSPDVFVGMASIPSRSKSLRSVVASLTPQVQRLGVYLNGYPEVPDFLTRNDRVVVARSQDLADIRDNGKFFFLEGSGTRYYATVDDDINYPADYIHRLVEFHKLAGPNSAVGVHATLYPSPIIDLVRSRYLLHFATELTDAVPVHLLGTGTALFDQSAWNLKMEEFGQPGMADVWFARAAARRGAPLFAIPRDESWLSPFHAKGSGPETMGALFYEALIDGTQQASLLREADISGSGLNGLISSILASPGLAEGFTLRQAALIAAIRRRLGLAPLSADEAASTAESISFHRANWRAGTPNSEVELSVHAEAIASLLAEQVSTTMTIQTLRLLGSVEKLRVEEPETYASVPDPVRVDASPSTLADTRIELVGRAVRTDRNGASELWGFLSDKSSKLQPDLVLDFERAAVDTDFIRRPRLRSLASRNIKSATEHVYEYLEAREWSVRPDPEAWKDLFGLSFNRTGVQMLLSMAALRSGDTALAQSVANRLEGHNPDELDVLMLQSAMRSWTSNDTVSAITPVLSTLDIAIGQLGLTAYGTMVDKEAPAGHWINLFATSQLDPQPTEDQPTITVIMTTYNQAETLPGAVAAVLASRRVGLELIVVDDASTDATPEFLSTLDDPRVTTLRNSENLGPYASRNRALVRAKGEFVAIADADDWSHPDRLGFQCDWLTQHPEHLACTIAHIRLLANGKPVLENHMLFLGDAPVSVVFRRLVVDHVGGFDRVRTRGDIEFLRRLRARFGEVAVSSLRAPLLLATASPSSNSKAYSSHDLNLYRAAFRTWHRSLRLSDALFIDPEGGPAPFIVPYEIRAPSPESQDRSRPV